MPTTTIRYDEAVRDQAAPLLESMGISLNTYLNMALRQLVVQRRVPFEVKGEPDEGWYVVPGASPRVRREGDRFIVPADWADDDDE